MKRREIVPVTALVPLQGHLCERGWRTGPPEAISHTKWHCRTSHRCQKRCQGLVASLATDYTKRCQAEPAPLAEVGEAG